MQKMEEVCMVGHKNCERIFGVEELSSVQKSSRAKAKSKTRYFYVIQPLKFTLALSICWGFCQGKSVFSLTCLGKLFIIIIIVIIIIIIIIIVIIFISSWCEIVKNINKNQPSSRYNYSSHATKHKRKCRLYIISSIVRTTASIYWITISTIQLKLYYK